MNIQPERSVPSTRATMSGQLALIAWALSPAGAAYLKNLPAFQVLLGIFLAGFIASSITNTVKKNWKDLFNRPKYLVLAGIFGIVPNDIFYIFAFKYAPAIQVDLIVCMWPMFLTILATIFLREEIGIVHIFACLIAFCGCYIAIYSNIKIEEFRFEYIFGYICAFMSAFLWAIYAVISKKYAKSTPELFALYWGVGAMFSAIMHFSFETTVIPSIWAISVLFMMGVITHSLAYYMWDFAIKKGHFNLLGIMPYGNIILSVLALAIFGFAELSSDIIVATLMIFAAGLLTKYHGITNKKKT
jgi:drug/metabolite transporter (DMT)-like permease